MREIFYNTLAAFVPGIGLDRLASLENLMGGILWRALPKRRRLAINNIREHLGLTESNALDMARKSFGHNARSFMELLFLNQVDWRFYQDRLTLANPDILEAFRNDKNPTMAVTAHLGAWEFLNSLMGIAFANKPVRIVVVRKSKDRAMNDLMFRVRSRPGVCILPHRQAIFPVLKAMRKGGLAAFLVDHNCTREEAIFLPFLGKTAAVNVGPALLAVRSKADIWPAFMLRQSEGRYILHQEPPLLANDLKGTREEKIKTVAEFYTSAVEKYVRMYPEQWFWMHNRWKTRPIDGEQSD